MVIELSLVQNTRMLIKRISTQELMKIQDIVTDEVTRRETTKYNTKGEEDERKSS